MPRGRYRITNPTLAMKTNDDHGNTTLMVPKGAFIFIDSESFNGNRLIDAQSHSAPLGGHSNSEIF